MGSFTNVNDFGAATKVASNKSVKDMRILVAPSGFKESLGPEDVADCIEEGVRRVLKKAQIRKLPLHDGGEGFCKALVAAKGGEMRERKVTGPVHKPVDSHYGVIGEGKKTAVLDMAAAAGLRLVPRDCRDPTATTTFGVGELIKAALDDGCTTIIIGCGDSGTSDGGAGMLQALGAQLLDGNGEELARAGGGGSLASLDHISMETIHPRLRGEGDKVQIQAVCNIKNVLCGEQGVARVYGPQKGATKEQVETLSAALDRLAKAAEPILGADISSKPGSGASGGLGAGLMLIGTELRARSEAVSEYFGFDDIFDEHWDLVLTAEGSLDFQSSKGKMTVEIAKRAQERGTQVIALAGTIGDGANSVYDSGIEAFTSILDGPITLEEAMKDTERLLKDAAEKAMRMVQMGMSLRDHQEPLAALRDLAKSKMPGIGHRKQSIGPSEIKVSRATTF